MNNSDIEKLSNEDLVKIIKNSILNKLSRTKIKWTKDKSMTVVLCSKRFVLTKK